MTLILRSIRILPTLLILLLLRGFTAVAQHRVDPAQMYERAYAILPIIGTGTLADPKRPMFMPVPSQMKADDRTGIIAYHHVASDDGKFALVEIVAANKAAIAPFASQITAQAAQTAGVQFFDSSQSRTVVEQAFKAQKKSFDFNGFRLAVQ